MLSSSNAHVQICRIIEGCTRSLNNILERLHQSFFFYYLPAPYRYISIGDYMPGVGCLIGAILVCAIAAWMHWSRLTVRAVDERIAAAKESKKSAEVCETPQIERDASMLMLVSAFEN